MDFKALFSQLVVLYEKLTKQQRMIIAVAIVGIVSFLVFLVVFTSKKNDLSDYAVLFDSLSSSDASKVIEQLDKNGVPYKILQNNVIKVPKDVVYKERIAIASLGIPKDKNVGFELFDKQEFGATNFDQQIKHLRALEGELSRTINALEPVESATVNLALPQKTLFTAKKSEPTASVMVTLVDGKRLTPKQIRGIKNLVAAAVADLKPSNVMLVDNFGDTLGGDDEMAQMSELSAVQQKFKEKEERKKQQKIIDVIAPFVGGRDKVVAQVSIEYDFSIKNATSETYDPDNVVRSEQVIEENREGFSPKQVGGVPGTVSNIGPVQGLKSDQKKEKYTKNSSTTNYEISKTVATTKSQFARIKRITAAVLVDGEYTYKKLKDGTLSDELVYKPLSKSELDALKSLVTEAIGINTKRGDKATVHNLQFKRDSKNPEPTGVAKIMKMSELYLAPFSELFKYIFVVVLLFVVYKKVMSPFAEKMLEVSKEDDDLEKPILDIDEEEDEDIVEKVQAARKKVEEQLGLDKSFNEDELKHDVLLEKVKEIVEENPEEIASLLKALLQEESELTHKEK
ncbi:Flagellar M-ring protein FliF [hydrothermal vent metagenome]|uniref:Flagellar M-ring protein FliF n=1 Tax=hydrothermal vent metagenome TaxID=652676 RepID=A0A1W1D4W2_9ZZZZ